MFRWRLPHGWLVGVPFSDAAAAVATAAATLPPAAQALAREAGPATRPGFVAGRVALGEALKAAGFAPGPLGRLPGGAPEVPAGAMASVSHKPGLAVALAASTDAKGHDGRAPFGLGVDLERLPDPQRAAIDIARRVLTPQEQRALSAASAERARQVRYAFAVKEAVYKALAPRVGRYIGFHEAELPLPLPTPPEAVDSDPALPPYRHDGRGENDPLPVLESPVFLKLENVTEILPSGLHAEANLLTAGPWLVTTVRMASVATCTTKGS